MYLVKNNPDYWEFIRKLRNNRKVKRGFIQKKRITKEAQDRYMSQYNDHYYICIHDDKPVGYIGEISLDIRLAVSPLYQGMGVGKFMLTEFMKIVPNAYGKVLIGNERSVRLFAGSGFTEINRTNRFHYFIKKTNKT